MKKVFSLLLMMVVLVLSLAACSNAKIEGSDSEGSDSESDVYKVAVLTIRKMTTPADFNTLEGIEKLKAEYGDDIDIKIIECIEIAEYKEQVQAVSEEGYDVVYFIYDNFLPAVKELAPYYPDTKYIGLWIKMSEEELAEYPNVQPLFFKPEEGSFMAGVAAAKMTETGKVGFLGGGNNPGIITFLAGYEAGIKYADSSVELVVTWANTFEDPIKGKELADSMYSRDVDIIFQVANQTGLGVFTSAQSNGKYAIGVDVDQSHLAPENIIASVLLDHGYATYDSINKAYMGNFENKQVMYGLEEGMSVIATTHLIKDDILAEMDTIQKKIKNGEIQIPITTITQ
jgi:basic membrane protein A